MTRTYDRREFVRTAAAGTLGIGFAAAGLPETDPGRGPRRPASLDVVRVGFVGVGHQGSSHVQNFLKIPGVDIRAICDLVPEKVAAMQRLVREAGRPEPAGFSRGPEDFRRMCDEAELDLVFTATPWELHAPVCTAALRSGKHAATEVPLAVTVDECWRLVELSEQTGRHCAMMENCCYDRTEMMILNMVRQGVLGELIHAECGYLHDLRTLKLTDYYEGRWRIKHSIGRNGDLYPTHGLGPVAQSLNVNRGNRFTTLVSMASASRGLNLWAAAHLGPESPEAKQRYALGDAVTTFIRTAAGQTVVVTHDTDSPRPYSRNVLIQGTKGLVRKYPEEKIYLEGSSPADQWEDLVAYRERYEHPIWRTLEEQSRGAGHGGMDYIEDYRLVECLRTGQPLDLDVYDGAAWSAVSGLSERSIAAGSRPQEVPDFTRGRWKDRPPLGIIGGAAPSQERS
jgi:predicted dehydrogenase